MPPLNIKIIPAMLFEKSLEAPWLLAFPTESLGESLNATGPPPPISRQAGSRVSACGGSGLASVIC